MGQLATSSVKLLGSITAAGDTSDMITIFAPVATDPDITPRVFGSASAIDEQHGYSEGLEYAALHIQATRKPVIFVGLPIGTPGAVGRVDSTEVTGGGNITATAGADGVLAEHTGYVRVIAGGTVGSSPIKLELSLDGGVTKKIVRLGTAGAYAVPRVNVQLGFSGVLSTGAVFRWFGSGPIVAAGDLTTAREALAAGSDLSRTWILIGDCPSPTLANAFGVENDAYLSANGRAVTARASVRDRLPHATLSKDARRMVPGTSLTFAEVGASGDTITRADGSWIADGFAIGDTITIAGATASAGANNISAVIANLTATVITLGSEDLTAEVSANCTVIAYPTLTFAEVGASGDTITRNRGSWIADGFYPGCEFSIEETAANDGDYIADDVSDLVITLDAEDLDAEIISVEDLVFSAGETEAEWIATLDDEFADTVTGYRFLDLSAGRSRRGQSIDGWVRRVPVAWEISIREYQHDRHMATWYTGFGALAGASVFDERGQRVEYDDRVAGGAASQARFSSLRTYANGGRGTFVSQSLTRADEADLLSQTHHASVVAKFINVIQATQEKALIGLNIELTEDGLATPESIATVEKVVRAAIDVSILSNTMGEGRNASAAQWFMDPTTDFRVPNPTSVGNGNITLNGTVHSVTTNVQVNTGS